MNTPRTPTHTDNIATAGAWTGEEIRLRLRVEQAADVARCWGSASGCR